MKHQRTKARLNYISCNGSVLAVNNSPWGHYMGLSPTFQRFIREAQKRYPTFNPKEKLITGD